METRDDLVRAAEGMLGALELGARSGEGISREWCRELFEKYSELLPSRRAFSRTTEPIESRRLSVATGTIES